MKKNRILFTILCASIVYALLLSSCRDGIPDGASKPHGNTGEDNVVEQGKNFSAFSSDQQSEIQKLYGYYWMEGAKDNFLHINDGNLKNCSTAMSFAYTNLLWNRLSDKKWICTSYHSDNGDYEANDRKVVLTITKDDAGAVSIWQYVVPMDLKSGPFKKGKMPDIITVKENGQDVEKYVYDKSDAEAPKIGFPTWI